MLLKPHGVQRVQSGFGEFVGHSALAVWAAYSRTINVASIAVGDKTPNDSCELMLCRLPANKKWALIRDNGLEVLIPTVCGVASVAGACGASLRFRNTVFGTEQLKESIDQQTRRHKVVGPSTGLQKASASLVLESINLAAVGCVCYRLSTVLRFI